MKRRALVIAFGNPLRRDDGVGYRAASLLNDTLPDETATIIFRQQLTQDLVFPVGEADRVIFIDAEIGPPPGTISLKQLAPPSGQYSALLHQTTPAELLAWTGVIRGRMPRADQVTVAGAAFDFGEQLTPPVAAALPALVRVVTRLVVRDATVEIVWNNAAPRRRSM